MFDLNSFRMKHTLDIKRIAMGFMKKTNIQELIGDLKKYPI